MQTDKEKRYGGVNEFVVDLKVILESRKHPPLAIRQSDPLLQNEIPRNGGSLKGSKPDSHHIVSLE